MGDIPADSRTLVSDGLRTIVTTVGNGPPVLMLAPGGWDATIARWSAGGVWTDIRPLDTLASQYTVIAYDRREAGRTEGRLEVLTWERFARHAIGVLDALQINRVSVVAGCMGCALALQMAVSAPDRVERLLLHWPVGGIGWREAALRRFDDHLALVRTGGLHAWLAHVGSTDQGFWKDPLIGPWGSATRHQVGLARTISALDPSHYIDLVTRSSHALFPNHDPAGAPLSSLRAIRCPTHIFPGRDPAHATSVAFAISEVISGATLRPTDVEDQSAIRVKAWLSESLA